MFVPKFILLAVVGVLGLAVFAAPVKYELAPSKRELLEAVVPTPKLQRRVWRVGGLKTVKEAEASKEASIYMKKKLSFQLSDSTLTLTLGKKVADVFLPSTGGGSGEQYTIGTEESPAATQFFILAAAESDGSKYVEDMRAQKLRAPQRGMIYMSHTVHDGRYYILFHFGTLKVKDDD